MNDSEKACYLLDTNIISEVVKYSPDIKVIEKMLEHSSDMAISVLTWHELLYGTERLPDGLKKRELMKYLTEDVADTFRMIPFTKGAAEVHARIRVELAEQGVQMPFGDSQIAASAIAENMILVTRNVRHFNVIADLFSLTVENWFQK